MRLLARVSLCVTLHRAVEVLQGGCHCLKLFTLGVARHLFMALFLSVCKRQAYKTQTKEQKGQHRCRLLTERLCLWLAFQLIAVLCLVLLVPLVSVFSMPAFSNYELLLTFSSFCHYKCFFVVSSTLSFISVTAD